MDYKAFILGTLAGGTLIYLRWPILKGCAKLIMRGYRKLEEKAERSRAAWRRWLKKHGLEP